MYFRRYSALPRANKETFDLLVHYSGDFEIRLLLHDVPVLFEVGTSFLANEEKMDAFASYTHARGNFDHCRRRNYFHPLGYLI